MGGGGERKVGGENWRRRESNDGYVLVGCSSRVISNGEMM